MIHCLSFATYLFDHYVIWASAQYYKKFKVHLNIWVGSDCHWLNKRSIFGNRYKTAEVPELIDCFKCWKNMELTYYKEEEPGKGDHSYCRRTTPTTGRSSRTPSCPSPLCLGNFCLVLSLTQNHFNSRQATFTSLCLKTPSSCPLQHLLISSET